MRHVETQEIRYIHYMSHPDYPDALGCGCVCAEHMEDDYINPRLRENKLKNAAHRRKRWLSRRWQTSSKGNDFINVDDFNIVIFENDDGTWGGRIRRISTGETHFARRRYETEARAKLAAFDAMIFMVG